MIIYSIAQPQQVLSAADYFPPHSKFLSLVLSMLAITYAGQANKTNPTYLLIYIHIYNIIL